MLVENPSKLGAAARPWSMRSGGTFERVSLRR